MSVTTIISSYCSSNIVTSETPPPDTTELTLRQQVADDYATLISAGATERQALIDFVDEIDSVYEKLIMVQYKGHKLNVIDPDANAIGTLSFPFGEPSSNSLGYNWAGDGKYADSGIDWSRIPGNPLPSLKHKIGIYACVYLQDTVPHNWYNADSGFQLYIASSGLDVAYVNIDGNSDPIPYSSPNGPGLKGWQCKQDNSVEFWRGTTKEGTGSIAHAGLTGSNILLNKNIVSTITNTSSLTAIGVELTDDDVVLLHTAIETLMQATGASVL